MTIRIYDNMFLNIQTVSVTIKPEFVRYFKKTFLIDDVQIHAGNVYMFSIPLEGEQTALNENQKKFIFHKEFSLYEEQYDIHAQFDPVLFDQFFEITWHGVAYHVEIKSL